MQQLKRIFIGKPLKSSDEGNQKLGRFKALAMLSSDALSSVAYGTEEIVIVLTTLSAAAIWYSIPIAAFVLVLLLSLTLSYRQVIHAYPGGGGAYVVSSENLGKNAGLVAGGSLLVDYMLTVAVSISAGAEAITSAIPALYGHQVGISFIIVLILMGMNLRGMRESASFLMVPVYLFVLMMTLMIIVGCYKIFTGAIPFHATSTVGAVVPGVSMALIFRAFSSGSSSLTGVEAISNAVPFFKKPRATNAAETLAIMAAILGFFFAGITFLNYWYGIVPAEKVTVLSQVAQHTFGKGFLFYIVQFATAFILAVAANTGFSAFPVLAYNLAKDKYMPHMYMDRGDRLGYSNGIITLAIGSMALIFIFNGDTSRLIPLYAVGVFIPFTLSQSGMLRKWWVERPKNWFGKSIANFVGALISFAILVILFVYRLPDIWPFFIIMPVMIWIFYKIHDHYKKVALQLRVSAKEAVLHDYDGSTVIVLVSNVTQVTRGALDYAQSIGDYVIAMHVSTDENPAKEREIQAEFKEDFPNVRFVDVHSSYRSIQKPIVRFVDIVSKNAQKRNFTTTVLVPQFVPRKPWQNILHNQSSLRLRTAFANRENIIISTYSYHLKH
ncbi:APC family permease [Latilactobacillus curvatus]|jgi:amino acid transporter|uniref:APC family permease n=2 Tax=Latilactobacillus curvatus TaxID=28038 RepID=A0A0B2XMB7_LATCU|nr:APC family permease [Latilactobacillus curvatus]MDT3393258.1 APC family permease [Bacillota bacterium]ASN60675.1 APC family permease [Latilactobacillus curvatus]EHE86854.1 amino acid permease family protein [Latilactobacillus curvatus CRL 705]KHO13049.1 amino acid permease family protein [Latilactobacillus curvatus]KRK85687.1 amino acid permease family protein [Latilactobacillus curvatus JCM 1096 = DSM 20019]